MIPNTAEKRNLELLNLLMMPLTLDGLGKELMTQEDCENETLDVCRKISETHSEWEYRTEAYLSLFLNILES